MARIVRNDRDGKPDLVIGVDFGMTYTGVAFSNMGMPVPHAIQVWPGEDLPANKVPTLLLYESQDGERRKFRAWGYQCREVEQEVSALAPDMRPVFVRRRNFKTLLGGRSPDFSPEEIKGWFRDYLRQIYLHVKTRVEKHLDIMMSSLKVEFVFSLPTTWTAQSVINDFREVIIDAGFERGGKDHKVSIGLTEAQAIAVYATKYSLKTFKDGDVLLICDAGGGTTDLCLLEMKIADANTPVSFIELAPSAGVEIGSTDIDGNFETFVKKRLSSDPNVKAHADIDQIVEDMVTSKAFQKIKCLFGTPESRMKGQVPCPGMPKGYQNLAIGVENGMMAITQDDVHRMYHQDLDNADDQNRQGPVPTIKRLIDAQLNQMKAMHPGRRVDYLILSGGLGGSEHLLNYLRSEYIPPWGGDRDIETIISSEDPQLGVAKGLVMNSIAKSKCKPPIIGSRSCRASYGVVVDKEYNAKTPNHKKAEVYVHPTSKIKYARRQINWMIKKKGQPITPETDLSVVCQRVVLPSDSDRHWMSIIVICHNDAAHLPHSMDEGGAQKLCDVESNFTDVPLDQFKEQNKKWYKSKKHHFVAEYKIEVNIGPADISFEVVHNGHVMSKDNSVTVQWGEAASIPAPKLIEKYSGSSTDILLEPRIRGR